MRNITRDEACDGIDETPVHGIHWHTLPHFVAHRGHSAQHHQTRWSQVAHTTRPVATVSKPLQPRTARAQRLHQA